MEKETHNKMLDGAIAYTTKMAEYNIHNTMIVLSNGYEVTFTNKGARG